MQDFDVVVVGAGLSGLETARRLGTAGLRVLLADRKPTLSYAIHTTGIFVRRSFDDFELPADCLGPAIRHVRLHSPAGRQCDLVSSRDEFRLGRMGRLYAERLNQCRQAGVQVALETPFRDWRPAAGGGIVRLSLRRHDWCVRTRFVIAADGAKSKVAPALGLSENREWIVGLEKIYRNVPQEGPPRLHCVFDPKLAPGYIAWIVHENHEVHLGVAGYPGRFRPAQAIEAFRDVAARCVDLSHAEFREQRSGLIPIGGVLPTIANAHGLAVGDAAGAVSPLTAGGLDPCLRLSAIAAQTTAQYLHTNDASVLETYDGREFRSNFAGRLLLRRGLRAASYSWMMEAGFMALRIPWMQRLAARVFFGDGSFPAELRESGLDPALAPN